MPFKAFVRAAVLLIMRRWWGRTSATSSESNDSTSEKGIPSSSCVSSGIDAAASSPHELLSWSLSSPHIPEVSFYGLLSLM